MLKSTSAFVDVLVASVIDLLQRGRPVHIPGLGTWSVEHTPAGVDVEMPGQVRPPQDRIVFTPEKP